MRDLIGNQDSPEKDAPASTVDLPPYGVAVLTTEK
jgi:hypothetical protein